MISCNPHPPDQMYFLALVYLPLVCWAGWEFARRYTGPRPRWYSLGLVGLPLAYPVFPFLLPRPGMAAAIPVLALPIVFLYRIFTSYPAAIPKDRKRVNRFALVWSLTILVIPVASLASLLVLFSFMIWSRGDEAAWWALVIGVQACLLVTSLIYVAIWSYQRSSLRHEGA